jgi:hypothetical protein
MCVKQNGTALSDSEDTRPGILLVAKNKKTTPKVKSTKSTPLWNAGKLFHCSLSVALD